MNLRRLLACALLAGVPGSIAVYSWAQPFVIESDVYRVRVINQMDRRICIKIIAYGRDTYFHADLAPNADVVQDLYAGQRAVCVWDDRNGDLLITAPVNVNRSGVLRIRAVAWPARADAPPAARSEAAEAPAATSGFSIENE